MNPTTSGATSGATSGNQTQGTLALQPGGSVDVDHIPSHTELAHLNKLHFPIGSLSITRINSITIPIPECTFMFTVKILYLDIGFIDKARSLLNVHLVYRSRFVPSYLLILKRHLQLMIRLSTIMKLSYPIEYNTQIIAGGIKYDTVGEFLNTYNTRLAEVIDNVTALHNQLDMDDAAPAMSWVSTQRKRRLEEDQ